MDKIVFQSAGSLSIAMIALIMVILQLIFILKKTRFVLYVWSVAVSFSAMLYAIGIFFEYNAPPGSLNQWAGRLEFTAIIFLVHVLFGFTFTYFKIDGKRYHQVAGVFHLLLLVLLWCSDIIVADRFVTRNFIGLSNPYIESDLGPLGPLFMLYSFLASIIAIALWIRFDDPGDRYKTPFLSGIVLWVLLGLHDGMAALGVATFQYLMEYGFLFFSIIILWVVSSRFYDMLKEKELKESEEKIARLKKMESLGLLAGGVAHDLNNVLSGIASYPELLLMDLPEESSLRQPLITIQDSGQRAAAIVNELLTITRGAAIEKKVMSLNRVVSDYIRSPEHTKLLMFHPRVRVETRLDSQLFNIKGSSMHFGKAVMNLVSNATEAIAGEGRVIISTTNRYLDRGLNSYTTIPKGEYAVLTVEDNGSGIDLEDLDRIFEPFFTKKVMGRSGTGLGMTLVWNVAQDHGCHIDVISNKNGTRFDIYCHTTHEKSTEATQRLPLENFLGKGERILVVDDVRSQREITCLMLNKLGYVVDSVSCGEGAIEYIKEHGGVDLLLLDMIMDPGISGRETYERVKAIQPDQKAIVLSGFSETDDVSQTLRAGAAKYLRKPVNIDVLGQAVKEVVCQRR